LNGEMLATLCNIYVEQINGCRIPIIEKAITNVYKNYSEQALKDIESLYMKLVAERLTSQQDTNKTLKEIKIICLKRYKDKMLNTIDIHDASQLLSQLKNNTKNELIQRSKEDIKRYLEKEETILKNLSFTQYKEKLKEISIKLSNAIIQPKDYFAFTDLVLNTLENLIQHYIGKSKKENELKGQYDKLKTELKEKETEIETLKATLNSQGQEVEYLKKLITKKNEEVCILAEKPKTYSQARGSSGRSTEKLRTSLEKENIILRKQLYLFQAKLNEPVIEGITMDKPLSRRSSKCLQIKAVTARNDTSETHANFLEENFKLSRKNLVSYHPNNRNTR